MTGRALVTVGALVVAVVAATPTSALEQPVTTKTVTVQIAGRSFPAKLVLPDEAAAGIPPSHSPTAT